MKDGFEIPIHRSLTDEIMIAGVPRTLAIMNGSIGFSLGMGAHAWYVIIICVIFHLVAVVLTKKDPKFFDCLLKHIKFKSYYSA